MVGTWFLSKLFQQQCPSLRHTERRGKCLHTMWHTFREVSTVIDHTSQYTGDIFLNVLVRKVQLHKETPQYGKCWVHTHTISVPVHVHTSHTCTCTISVPVPTLYHYVNLANWYMNMSNAVTSELSAGLELLHSLCYGVLTNNSTCTTTCVHTCIHGL